MQGVNSVRCCLLLLGGGELYYFVLERSVRIRTTTWTFPTFPFSALHRIIGLFEDVYGKPAEISQWPGDHLPAPVSPLFSLDLKLFRDAGCQACHSLLQLHGHLPRPDAASSQCECCRVLRPLARL